MSNKKKGKITYVEPENYIPQDIFDKVFGEEKHDIDNFVENVGFERATPDDKKDD